jgi:hypothetical protein
MMVLLGAHLEGNELVVRRAFVGFAARDEIGAGTSDGVFD